jgi:hypothetical protein
VAKKPETRFKDSKVWPFLRSMRSCYWRKIQNRTVRGLPDFLGCVRGNFIGLELKKSGNEPIDPLQAWNFTEIVAAGGLAIPVYPENWEEVRDTLDRINRGEIELKDIKDLSFNEINA